MPTVAKKSKTKSCDCATKVNAALEPYNTRLKKIVTMTGNTLSLGIVMVIETEKIDSKKRQPAKTVFPTYCPFCGKKL